MCSPSLAVIELAVIENDDGDGVRHNRRDPRLITPTEVNRFL